MIEKGKFSFDIPQLQGISEGVKDLISKCLVPEDKRISAAQILDHPWMKADIPKN